MLSSQAGEGGSWPSAPAQAAPPTASAAPGGRGPPGSVSFARCGGETVALLLSGIPGVGETLGCWSLGSHQLSSSRGNWTLQ